MLKAKTKAPEPSLLERLHAFRAELNEFIDAKAAELKASRDGATLPIGICRAQLDRNDGCLCRVVARILGDLDA
jgi:hypothetical protein